MKRLIHFVMLATVVGGLLVSCRDDNDDNNAKATGKLKLSVSAITITSTPSGGRVKDISTDNFIVKIYKTGVADPVQTFNPWSSAPEFIELATGEYHVEAM